MNGFKIGYLLVFVFFFSCKEVKKENNEADLKKEITEEKKGVLKKESTIKIYNYDELAPLLHKQDDKIHVVNFWATWCKPCVEELPAFEKLQATYKDKNVEVLLVSIDFPNQIEEQLVPFIKENKIQSEVVVLDDPYQNKWINAIDKTWSGALPATLIYKNNKRAFYEQSFDEELLLKEVDKFIN